MFCRNPLASTHDDLPVLLERSDPVVLARTGDAAAGMCAPCRLGDLVLVGDAEATNNPFVAAVRLPDVRDLPVRRLSRVALARAGRARDRSSTRRTRADH